jgi:hypothetical protein
VNSVLNQLEELLPFSSGSHIVVQLPLADRVLRNAYSLMNDPYDQYEYKIAAFAGTVCVAVPNICMNELRLETSSRFLLL